MYFIYGSIIKQLSSLICSKQSPLDSISNGQAKSTDPTGPPKQCQSLWRTRLLLTKRIGQTDANSTRNARIFFLFHCNHNSGIVPHWYSVQQHDQMPTKTGETARGSKHSTDKRMKSEDQILPILDGNTLWWTNIAIENGHL